MKFKRNKAVTVEPTVHDHSWKTRGYQNVAAQERRIGLDVARQDADGGWGNNFTSKIGTDMTRILRKCDTCDEYKVDVIEGTWTAQQLGLDV